eukprot:6198594-Pleurochrysis_carterae.AAC.1
MRGVAPVVRGDIERKKHTLRRRHRGCELGCACGRDAVAAQVNVLERAAASNGARQRCTRAVARAGKREAQPA